MTFSLAMQESFLCSNCRDVLRDPVILLCGENVTHYQCRSCVQAQYDLQKVATIEEEFFNQVSNKSDSEDTTPKSEAVYITCYKCNKTHLVDPLIGVECFKSNTTLQETINEYLTKSTKCEGIACNEDATIECERCEFRFCESCSKKVHSTANHSSSIKKFGSSNNYRKCSRHDRKKMDLYCLECEKELCSMCLLNHDKDHVIQPIIDVSISCAEDIRPRLTLLTQKLEELDQLVHEISSLEDQVSKESENACTLIVAETQRIQEVVLQRREELVQEEERITLQKRKFLSHLDLNISEESQRTRNNDQEFGGQNKRKN
jgi:hypothetical protein